MNQRNAVKNTNYNLTFIAGFFGIGGMAVVTNVSAILFVPFTVLYGFSFWQLGLLVGVSFAVQTLADIVLTFIIDRIKYKRVVILGQIIMSAGFVLYALCPYIFDDIFIGIIICTIVFSFSSGMGEVVFSPIIDSVPETVKNKSMAMSLLHSFYAWGQVVCIVVTSLYLLLAPPQLWNLILFFWALVPLVCIAVSIPAPMEKRAGAKQRSMSRKTMLSPFFIAALLAIMFGAAAEVTMNQWTATFAVKALNLSKATADLVGMCLFAVFLGLGRMLYGKFGDKINLSKALMLGSLGAAAAYLITGLCGIPVLSLILSILCGLFVSLLWPGTLVLASNKFPAVGAWIFAVLAISGDIGAGIGPAVTGFLADGIGLRAAIAIMAIFPLLTFLCHLYLYKKNKDNRDLPEK